MKRIVFHLLFFLIVNSISGQPTDSITDTRDGQVYKIIKIGDQWWMAENLAYLPAVDSPAILSGSYSHYYVYGYEGTNVSEAQATDNFETYGVLYNWPAAVEVCPAGWRLPGDADWKELEMFLGMSESEMNKTSFRGIDEGGKLKETGTSHWNSPNAGATNLSGFSALPGGYQYTAGEFYGMGYLTSFWSTTEYNTSTSWARMLTYDHPDVSRGASNKGNGFSVRCIKEPDPLVISFTVQHITGIGGSDGVIDLEVTGGKKPFQYSWSTGSTDKDLAGLSAGVYSVIVIDAFDSTITDSVRVFDTFVDERDSFKYKAVQIGDQFWMAENLNTGKFVNVKVDPTDNGIIEKYCYNNDERLCNIYGGLYVWNEMMDYSPGHDLTYVGITQGICPVGWHLPTYRELCYLINFLGQSVSGDKLKEAGTSHWNSPNASATNESGFTALPGGERYAYSFDAMHSHGFFWSSSEFFPTEEYLLVISENNTYAFLDHMIGSMGYSVRCLMDPTEGIPQSMEKEFKIIPNPFKEFATILFTNPEGFSYTLYIIDLTGKICHIVDDIRTSEYFLERGNLKDGLYLIELRGTDTFRVKIIVE